MIRRASLVKVKVHPITDHESPEVEWRYRSILSSTSALDEGWVVAPRPIYSWDRGGTHCTGGWVGPRDGLNQSGRVRNNKNLLPLPESNLDSSVINPIAQSLSDPGIGGV